MEAAVSRLLIIHVGDRRFVQFIANLCDRNISGLVMHDLFYFHLRLTRGIGDGVHGELGEAGALHGDGAHPVLGSIVPYLQNTHQARLQLENKICILCGEFLVVSTR